MIVNFENIIIAELDRARAVGEIGENCNISALARFIQIQIIGLRSYAEMHKSQTVIRALLQNILNAIETRAHDA